MRKTSTTMRRVSTVLASMVMVVAVATGCTGIKTESGSGSSNPGSLTIATSFPIDDVDPLENGYWGPEFGYIELLMRPQPDGKPTPWVLKSLDSVNETTWKLSLRDNVRFTNGTALDAAKLVELIDFANEKTKNFATSANIASVTAKSTDEVELKTTRPVPAMPNLLADEANVPVFDVAAYKKFLDTKGKPAELLKEGLFTGPYEITSLNEQGASLKPVNNYWDGTPALQDLKIKFVPEATSRVQAVKAGEADIALYMPTEISGTLKDDKRATAILGSATGGTFAFQMRNAGPYADTLVRRAVFNAIDYRALAEQVMEGNAQVATSMFGPMYNYSIDTQKTDLDEANKQLDQAGWVPGPDGIRTKDGQRLTMRMLSYPKQPDSHTIAVALQSEFKKVGIDVQVRSVPDLSAARKGDDWDVALAGASLLSFSGSPEGGLRSALVTGGSQNFMKISNAQLDGLVDTLGKTFDENKRTDLLKEIQQVIHDNGLWGPTILRKPVIVTNDTWKNYQIPIANMWVDAKTAP